MSRVHIGQKWVNTCKYPPEVTNTPKMRRIRTELSDFHKASTLSSWLFLKYDITYKQFRNKSKKRRDEIREEYERDTGHKVKTPKTRSYYEDDYEDDYDEYIDREDLLEE